MALSVNDLATGAGEELRLLATVISPTLGGDATIIIDDTGEDMTDATYAVPDSDLILSSGATISRLMIRTASVEPIRFMDWTDYVIERDVQLLSAASTVTILTSTGLYATYDFSSTSGYQDEVRYRDVAFGSSTMADYLHGLNDGDQFIMVFSAEAPQSPLLTTSLAATGDNEQIRVIVTLEDGAVNELEYEGRDGETPIGSIEGDNESDLPGNEGIVRLRLRSEDGGRRVIVNVPNGQAQQLLTADRSLYLYTFDAFIELRRADANGAGGGYVTWAAHLNSDEQRGAYDTLRNNLADGDRVLAVIADSGTIPNPYSLGASFTAPGATATGLLSVVPAGAVSMQATAETTAVMTGALTILPVAVRHLQAQLNTTANATATLSLVPAGAVSLTAILDAPGTTTEARLTVVQPVTRLAADLSTTAMATGLLSVVPAGAVALQASAETTAEWVVGELTVTPPARRSLNAMLRATAAMNATLSVDITDAERKIMVQINRGKLEDLGNGERPTATDLVQAVVKRKSGALDEAVHVFVTRVLNLEMRQGREKEEMDRGEVLVLIHKAGGETSDQFAGSIVTRSYVEVVLYATGWDELQHHTTEALNALTCQQRVSLLTPPDTAWAEDTNGPSSSFTIAVQE